MARKAGACVAPPPSLASSRVWRGVAMKLIIRLLFLPLLFLAQASGVAFGDDPSSITPLTLTQGDYGGGRIYLSVRFGNVMGVMRLDTGASTSRVALAPWNKDFPALGQSGSTGVSGQVARCEDVEARNVEIVASQGKGVGRARYEITRCPGGDDLLGLDFLSGARLSLDFSRKELIFFPKALSDSRPTPFRLLGPDRQVVGVDLRMGSAAAVGLFDTGAELSAVDQRFVDAHRRLFTPVKGRPKASEASGARIAARLYRINQLDLGEGHPLKGVYALAYDFGPLREALGPQVPIILGYNVLSRFNWELDFTSKGLPAWRASPRK